jgi:hypothetical protein
MNEPMTHDDVSKHTTPNAIREATYDRLDHVYNCAVSHLRNPDSGVVRQMEHSIRAINDERLRRRAHWPLAVSVISASIALISLALNFWVLFRHGLQVFR